jgi:hypothetical protein
VASEYYPASIDEPVNVGQLWEYILKEKLQGLIARVGASSSAVGLYFTWLKAELASGHVLLILDGLDEVGNLAKRQKQLKGLVQSIKQQYKGSRIIVTSRPYAYEGWSLAGGFEVVRLSDFEDEQRLELARRLYEASGSMSAGEAAVKAVGLNEQLENVDAELKDRPLFVTLMASLY